MSKSTATVQATASTIRVWAGENGFPQVAAAERGRLPQEVITKFEAATGQTYVTGGKSPAKSKTVTLPVVKRNAKGARLKRPVTVTVAEARTLSGAPAKGRLASKHVDAAARAYEVREFGSEQG